MIVSEEWIKCTLWYRNDSVWKNETQFDISTELNNYVWIEIGVQGFGGNEGLPGPKGGKGEPGLTGPRGPKGNN